MLVHLIVNLAAIGASTVYLRSLLNRNLEDQEARFDEIEGTVCGHVSFIQESSERLEGREKGKVAESNE